jgi:L-cysteine/cystine lyase
LSTPAPGLTSEEKRELLAGLLAARHRQHFPTLQHKAYFNYGAQGPLAAPALTAIDAYYRDVNAAGPLSIEGSLLAAAELQRTRAALAAALAAGAPERIALVDNTSTGCNVVLWGLDWQRGDHLLLGDHEYPAVAAAAREVARRHGLELGLLPTDGGSARLLADLDARLRPRTRLVVLSHVTWDRGDLLPLADILALCRERGQGHTRLLIDGAQAAGALPLDLAALGVDFYALPGHKWCCGPEGTGALYVDAEALADLRPTFIGPGSLRRAGPGDDVELHPGARRFETSTSPVALYAGWRAALTLHDAWGSAESRWQRIRKLAHRLWTALGELEPALLTRLQTAPPEAGLVFFRCHDEIAGAGLEAAERQERVVRALESYGILLRSIPGAGIIRASVHYLTLDADLDRLLAALAELGGSTGDTAASAPPPAAGRT